MRVGSRDENLVLINGEVARRASPAALLSCRTHAIFPDQFARAAVERLHNVVGIGEVDDAVVHQRRGLVGSALVHRPYPCQPEILHVASRDLRKRAVVPCLIIPADHQPVAGSGWSSISSVTGT